MSDLTRDEVLAAVHPIDDATIAEIIATGVDHDELLQACRFYAKDRTARTRKWRTSTLSKRPENSQLAIR